LLGGSLKDAVNVCIKQLGDFQLAVAIARVVEQSNEGPIMQDILKNTVLPIAFQNLSILFNFNSNTSILPFIEAFTRHRRRF